MNYQIEKPRSLNNLGYFGSIKLFVKLGIIVLLIITISCNHQSKSKLNIDVSNLKPEKITLKQYGNALFECDTLQLQSELKRLQPDFYYFLNADLDNPENIKQLHGFVTDKQLVGLYLKTKQVFPDVSILESQLTMASRRLVYYFPQYRLPEFYTYISGVYNELPVLADENAIVIGLDCYLGEKEEYYQRIGIPLYAAERMTSEHIVNDVFKAIYSTQFQKKAASKTILEEMIENGKRLFFLEAMQPTLADHLLIGYRETQLNWTIEHQSEVWAFLVSEQLLYKNDFLMFKKLFGDGPFTQEFSDQAPARLGEWIGWQIVRNFMENSPETSLKDLIQLTDYQLILAESKFKPKS
jgi:hypothetical protein